MPRLTKCFFLCLAVLIWSSTAVADRGRGGETLIRVPVSAETGGSFSDDPAAPNITVSIPAGALSADAELRVRRVNNPPGAGDLQTAASPAYKVKLRKLRGGKGKLVLGEPLKLAIAADIAPVHPELGEIATRDGSDWERLAANFYRPSDNTVVALTSSTNDTYRVVHRSLQAVSGEAVALGRDVFLHETFGNEVFFTAIGLNQVLNSAPPVAAVGLGVQVDISKVPAEIVEVMIGDDLDAKDAALTDPAVTRALVLADAVIGVKAFDDDGDGSVDRAGITCALCHVNVTTTEFELNAGTVALPIGTPQFDGVPNNAMDAGAILALTPFAQGAGQPVIDLLNSWGPGRFDIRALPDNPLEDNVNNPTAHPPIWNFVDLEEQGYLLGWDGLFANDGVNNNALASQAEAVYDLVMHANGAFGTAFGTLPPELSIIPPQALLDALAAAEAADPGNDVVPVDALLDLQDWMRSIVSPPPGAFDEELAEWGFELFYGEANCAACHSTPELTGPGLFTDITENPPEGGLAGGIRIPSLRGVSHTAPYFHDGSAVDLAAAVARLVDRGAPVPALGNLEQQALVEYLKSL